MGARDGLEAALLASWDRETLAVYADHLQGLGDPRGELIALDLELATRSTPELVQRRTSLLTGWLGRLVPSNPHTPWVGDAFKFGFVDNLRLEEDDGAEARLVQVLASPLAPYLKRVTIVGTAAHVATMLRGLSGDLEHPWLTELAVRVEGPGFVDPEAVSRWIAVTPALQQLDVHGHQVFAEFPHPGVQRLRVTGATAITGMFNDGDPMLNVRELDLAVEVTDIPYGTPTAGPLEALQLPALRVLDLSRNEPESRRMQYGEEEYDDEDPDAAPRDAGTPTALEVLAAQPIRTQLTRLRLPSIRSRQQLERLEQIVSHMPALEEIEIVRAHYFKLPAKLATTKAKFVRPAGWPWVAVAEIPEGDILRVQVPGSFGDETIRIADAAAVMERRFEDLDADARYAWTRFWALVDELGKLAWKTDKRDPHHTWTDERTFPAAIMVQALDACDVGGSGGWREFREVLRSRSPFAPGALLTVHRSRDL